MAKKKKKTVKDDDNFDYDYTPVNKEKFCKLIHAVIKVLREERKAEEKAKGKEKEKAEKPPIKDYDDFVYDYTPVKPITFD